MLNDWFTGNQGAAIRAKKVCTLVNETQGERHEIPTQKRDGGARGPAVLILDITDFMESVSDALDDPDGLLTSQRKPNVVMERGAAK